MKEPNDGPAEITLEEWRAVLKSVAGGFPDFPLRHGWDGTGVDTLRLEPENEPQSGVDVAKHVRGQ